MPYCDGLTCDTVVQLPWISTIIIVYYSTHVDRNIRFQPETPSKLLQPFSHYQRSLLIVLCPMWEFSKNRHRWHMMTLCLYFPAHNTTLILGHQSQTALGFSAFGSSLTSVIRLNAVYNVYSTIYSVLETTRCFHFHPRNLYNTWVAVSSV